VGFGQVEAASLRRCRSRVRWLAVGPGLRRPCRRRVRYSRAGCGVVAPARWARLAALSLENRYREKVGLTSAAMAPALGSSSCSSCSRFRPSSVSN